MMDALFIYHYFLLIFLLLFFQKNGVVVGTIDRLVNDAERRESHLPRYLLRRKVSFFIIQVGFEIFCDLISSVFVPSN